MKTKVFLGLVVGAFALIAPAFALAQSSNYASLYISIQTASGSPIPSYQGNVTVNASGASLSGTPSNNASLTYTTNFNNDNRTVTFWPGSYNVNIPQVSNYTYSYSSGCNGSLSAGNTANCTITAYQSGNGNGGTGTLIVYVQTSNTNCLCSNGSNYCCNNGYNYTPSNFTINISGNAPSPSSFQGSSSGTYVTLGSGSYSVNPQTMNGWTYTQSGNCSGTMYSGTSNSCTINYTQTNSVNNNQNCGSTACGGPLSCNATSLQALLGSTIIFTANGGNGVYTWTAPGQTAPNSSAGNAVNVIFSTPGPQTVTVVSNGQTAYCTVTVLGNGSPYYPSPGLPNSGFAPVAPYQYALALLLLMTFGSLAYPYVRRALLHIGG